MKKMLMITSIFYPATANGGPAVSITNMAKYLSKYYEITVVTNRVPNGLRTETNDSLESDTEVANIFGCKVFYLHKSSLIKIFKIAALVKPDIVYTSSIFSAGFTLPALFYGKFHKSVRTILSPRGELLPNAACRKALKKKAYLLGIGLIGLLRGVCLHATSEDEMSAVKKRYPRNEAYLIKNLVDIIDNVTEHPQKQPGYLKLISVGRIHPIKNVDIMIEAVGKCKGNIEYKIYGPPEDGYYFKKCNRIAKELGEDKKVEFCGMIDNSKLEEAYANSQVYLSLTQTENFGISIVEAMSYSCPVVISRNTPWQFNKDDGFGKCVSMDTLSEVVQTLNYFIDMNNDTYLNLAVSAHQWIQERMSRGEIVGDYLEMFGK